MEYELIQAIDSIANNIYALAQPRFIDWLAVILSGVSIIVSGAAICFAIRVANKQNKIALFEKRYEIYMRYIEYYALAVEIGHAENRGEIQRAWLDIDRSIWDETLIDDSKKIFSRADEIRFKMSQAKFLFDKDIGASVDDFISLLIGVIFLSMQNDKKSEIQQHQEKLIQYARKAESILIAHKMEQYLNLERSGDHHALHRIQL